VSRLRRKCLVTARVAHNQPLYKFEDCKHYYQVHDAKWSDYKSGNPLRRPWNAQDKQNMKGNDSSYSDPKRQMPSEFPLYFGCNPNHQRGKDCWRYKIESSKKVEQKSNKEGSHPDCQPTFPRQSQLFWFLHRSPQ